MTLHDLYNVRPVRITVCKQGANRQVWFMRKGEGHPTEDELVPLTSHQEVIVKADWSAVYCVVAAPGQTENGGLLAPDVTDRWRSADEIRKAAHYFMANGDLSVGLHDAVAEYGTVVENAVAPATFSIEGPDGSKHKITKGSWYVAIAPNDEGREKIEAGDFNGISIEGTGQRDAVITKGTDGQLHVPEDIAKAVGDGGAWADATAEFGYGAAALLYEAHLQLEKAAPGPDLDRSPKKNWVDRVGGFGKTNWIYRAAKWLANTKGFKVGRAIATAINAAKKGCATGDLNWPGAQQVNMGSRAQMCAAVKKWESMKAAAGVKKAKLSSAQRKKLPAGSFVFPAERAYPIHDEAHARNALSRASGKPEEKRVRGAVCRKYPAICNEVKKSEAAPTTPAEVTAILDTIDQTNGEDTVNDGLLRTIAKRLGATDDEIDALDPEDQLQMEKAAQPTFAELIAEREMEDELPKAFDALRSVTWRAFYGGCADGDDRRDPADVIATSLDEFKDWALGLVARVDVKKGEGKNAPTPRKCKSCGATLAKDATKCASCGAAYVAKAEDVLDIDALIKAFGPAPAGLIGDGGTTTDNELEADPTMLTPEETKRIEDLEKTVGEVKTGIDTLVKAHEDAQEPAAPTIEELGKAFNAHVEKTGSELETIAKGIKALTEGDSSQPQTGDDQIRKSQNGDAPDTIGLLS